MFKKISLPRIFGSLLISSLMITPHSKAFFSPFTSKPEKKLEVAKEKLNATKENLNSIVEKCESFYTSMVEATSKLEQSVNNLKDLNNSSKESFVSLNKIFNEWLESGCSSKSDLYNQYLSARETFNNNLENFKNTLKDINTFTEEINNLSIKPKYPYPPYKDTIYSLTKSYYNYEKANAELVK